MKKAFWWILGLLLSPVLLFVILTVLLYLPPVQNWAVQRVAAIASEKTGMQITVGHVQLSFPLDLSIDDFKMIHEPDTIADVAHLVVDVQLWPLLQKRVVVNELQVSNTRLNTNGFVDAVRVKGRFGLLSVKSRGIDLDKETVDVNGARLEDARIDIAMRDSVPEDTTTTETRWKIMADSVSVLRSDVTFHMPGDTMSVDAHFGALVAREALVDLESQTYTVGSADWTDGRLRYDQNFEPRLEGLDYNHLDLSEVNVGIDSIYYHDPDLRLLIRNVALREKSGLQLTELSGPLTMENGSVRLPRFRLKTPDSDVYVEMDMPLSLTDSVAPGKLRLRLDAQVGRKDLLLFMGDLPQGVRDRWPYYPLSVKGQANGNLDFLSFSDLEVDLPTAFHATATGFAANLNDLKRLRADVEFKARTQDLGFVTAMLPRDVQRNYHIPNGIAAEGRVKADGARYTADVTAREGKGTVKLKGTLDSNAMRYNAQVGISNLNLHHFMPHDSLYTLTADLTARGQGTDVFARRTTMQAEAQIRHLGYGHYDLDGLALTADLHDGRLQADVTGHNALFDGAVNIGALMDRKRVDATVGADLGSIDLCRLGFSEKPLAIGLCGHVDVTSDMKLTHHVSGLVSDLTIRADSGRIYRPTDIGLLVNARPDTTYVRMQSGDFIVKLDASGDYERLLRQCAMLGDTVAGQYRQRIIDQAAVRRLLPTMKVHVESKRDNPIANLLKSSQDMDFKDMLFDLSLSPETGVNGNGYVNSLTVGDMRLDTINFRLTERKDHLSFGGQVRNNKRNPQFVFNALFDGLVQERGITMGVRYFDAADKLGARLGAKVEMVDSGLNFHLVPERPVLGYKEFALNKDNFLFLGSNNRVKAKVDLIADDGTGVKIYSEDNDPTALQDLTVSLNRFNLDELTSVLPYVPRMSGILDGDYHLVQDAEGQLSVVSDMAVQGMTYEHSPIGNVSTELVYLQKEDDAHAVEARLLKDDVEIGLLSGTYYNKGEGSLDATFKMERLPLSIVNGFVPDQLAGLEGYGEGELAIKGPLSRPQVDGEVYLDSSYLVSVPYGMRLRFDNDPVRIVGSNLLFENFTIYAHNDNPLNIMGNVNFSDLDHILVNLRMRAKDYQIIGAKESQNSVAYGKAFVNFFGSMTGELDNLKMRGKLDVLGSTDMAYILRDSPLSTDNQLDELVKFTDFTDSTQTVVQRPVVNGFNMDLTVDVSQGAHILAFLNVDQTNYIDLMGGGTLRLLYSAADNLRLTGKYTLSNGEMKYSMPIIPLKTFTIQDGSYIEFTGEPMNPKLNITATEKVKASVASESGAGRSVTFDCGVVITKTLNDMGLEFTLDAPEDMQLHNELQSMSTEQRGKLAVTMLSTGMYLADGNTSAFSMNSALSSFLNSEINQLTGSALRTLDLSFGMDNSTDASGTTHTDYSFKFAKRFWNNRVRVVVGGMVSSGAEVEQRNKSFFDNVSLEYRLDNTANKYLTLFYQNNVYDWLDGYTQKYGGGFMWRRSLQNFTDLFRFKDPQPVRQPRPVTQQPADSVGSEKVEKVKN